MHANEEGAPSEGAFFVLGSLGLTVRFRHNYLIEMRTSLRPCSL